MGRGGSWCQVRALTHQSAVGEMRSILNERGYVVVDPGRPVKPLLSSLGSVGDTSVLRATDSDAAEEWSLSGAFGRNAFPWHTDGAISSCPPRWLVLRALKLSSSTMTDLLDLPPTLRRRLRRTVLLATDHAGRARYLPSLVRISGTERVRWDPRTCRPRDVMILHDIASTYPTATIEWQVGRTLIVDNHRLLHRRPAVAPGEDRVLARTYIWGC